MGVGGSGVVVFKPQTLVALKSDSDALRIAAELLSLFLAHVNGILCGLLVDVERLDVFGLVEGKLTVFAVPVRFDVLYACIIEVRV